MPARRHVPRQAVFTELTFFPDLVTEDIGFRTERDPVRGVLAHSQFRSKSRADGNHPQLVSLRICGRKNDPPGVAFFIPAHLLPLQAQ